MYYLERPKKESRLRGVLSLEVGALIKAIDYLKHRTIISLIYSGVLLISEAIKLKITEIDSDRMQMRIEQAKGKKDRMTLLSKGILELLRDYYRQHKPKHWLFEGQTVE